jgi:5-methylcytosine-specific restriction endonuclease McrA
VETIVKDMLSIGKHGGPSKFAMHVELELDPEGQFEYDGFRFNLGSGTRPCTWNEWVALEVRRDHHSDLAIHSKSFTMRAPAVAICSQYDKMPLKGLRWSPGNVHRRDNYICGYTGRKLTRARATVDHIIPRDKGGKDTWENTVTCDREVNQRKANKTPEEAGLKLLVKPKAPPKLPAWAMITEARHITWMPFLIARENPTMVESAQEMSA